MEKRFKYIAGLDEVGRGALCGPVVASCVCFRKKNRLRLKDSKKLSPRQREALFPRIAESSYFSFGLVDNERIDEINIFAATQLAFLKAIKKFLKLTGFKRQDVLFIIDGNRFKYRDYNFRCMVSADQRVREVSAASILAKVLRDEIVSGYDRLFSGWNFSRHKGYPTREHRRILKEKGSCPVHRLSFNLRG